MSYKLGTFINIVDKKACRNTVYEYSWEIDVCIRFFKTRLTWDKAKAYCEGNSSHLFTVESLVKEAIFLPKLKELQGKAPKINIMSSKIARIQKNE